MASSRKRSKLVLYIAGGILAICLGGARSQAATGPCTAPATDYGTVTSSVTVPTSGTYRVWSRMSAPDATNDTYLLDIDSASCYTVGGNLVPTYASGATTFFASNASNWIAKATNGGYIDVSLSAGTHTFKMIGNAAGVVLDRLVLTQDTACIPTGTGDNCASPPDTTAPTVLITTPANNAAIATPTTVTANAVDDAAMAKVEFYVDGTLKGTDTTGDVNHNYTYSFDPSAYGIGQHAIVAKAYDAAGNVTTSSTVTLKVPDAVAPTAIVSSPVSGATISGTATLAANATDNVAVSKVDFYVDGALKGTDTTGTSNAYSISLDTTALSNASHSAVAKSYDAAGNVTTSSSINFIVNNVVTPPADSTPPTVVLTLPTGTLAGTVTLGATANDPSGIAKVEFYVDGVLKNTDTTAPYSYSLDTKTLTNAAHSIKATAYDKATPANSASSQTLNVAINNVSYLTADINQDGIVDIQDFGLLKVKFGSAGTGLGRADINQDGIVDIQDFGLLKVKFGQGVQ